jgi:hypothetical protein
VCVLSVIPKSLFLEEPLQRVLNSLLLRLINACLDILLFAVKQGKVLIQQGLVRAELRQGFLLFLVEEFVELGPLFGNALIDSCTDVVLKPRQFVADDFLGAGINPTIEPSAKPAAIWRGVWPERRIWMKFLTIWSQNMAKFEVRSLELEARMNQ